MKFDERGLKWMKEDKRGWECKSMYEKRLKWKKVGESGWKLMKVNKIGWNLMNPDKGGWKCLKLDKIEWKWMKVDGSGKKWPTDWLTDGPTEWLTLKPNLSFIIAYFQYKIGYSEISWIFSKLLNVCNFFFTKYKMASTHYAEVGDISKGNLWQKSIYCQVNYTRKEFAVTNSL